MASNVVERDFDTKLLDRGLKNVWKWEWLERKVDKELVGRFIRKINVKGVAHCNLCRKDINYASRGWKSLEQHLQKKVHQDNLKIRSSNYSLSGRYILLFYIFLSCKEVCSFRIKRTVPLLCINFLSLPKL